MIKFRSAEDAQYYIFRTVLPNIAKNTLLGSGYSEDAVKIKELPDQDPCYRTLEVSSTTDGWTTWRNDFYITWNQETGSIDFRIMKINSSVIVTPGIDENGLMTEKTVLLAGEASWVGQQLEKRAAELGRPLNQFSPIEMREAIEFAGMFGMVEASIQYAIDSLRGWSPYENAEDYQMRKLSNEPLPTEPKVFFPEHDMPERYYDPNEEE